MKGRLFNSQTLLEATNLSLFTINEATLVITLVVYEWYNNISF